MGQKVKGVGQRVAVLGQRVKGVGQRIKGLEPDDTMVTKSEGLLASRLELYIFFFIIPEH